MLASPLLPSAPFSPKVSSSPEDPLSFRPARDVEAFNSLLPPPIEFVEGSSSGALAVPEGKYQPINVSPKLSTKDVRSVSLFPRTTSLIWSYHVVLLLYRDQMDLRSGPHPPLLPLPLLRRLYQLLHQHPRALKMLLHNQRWPLVSICPGPRHAIMPLVCTTPATLVF